MIKDGSKTCAVAFCVVAALFPSLSLAQSASSHWLFSECVAAMGNNHTADVSTFSRLTPAEIANLESNLNAGGSLASFDMYRVSDVEFIGITPPGVGAPGRGCTSFFLGQSAEAALQDWTTLIAQYGAEQDEPRFSDTASLTGASVRGAYSFGNGHYAVISMSQFASDGAEPWASYVVIHTLTSPYICRFFPEDCS